jgi:hypothetical protein
MKKIIVTNKQLENFIKTKKTEKVFYEIVGDLYENKKNLNENILINNVNQSIIDNYLRKNLITPEVNEMLIKYGIINEKREIL